MTGLDVAVARSAAGGAPVAPVVNRTGLRGPAG
jgi:hypothetical protein